MRLFWVNLYTFRGNTLQLFQQNGHFIRIISNFLVILVKILYFVVIFLQHVRVTNPHVRPSNRHVRVTSPHVRVGLFSSYYCNIFILKWNIGVCPAFGRSNFFSKKKQNGKKHEIHHQNRNIVHLFIKVEPKSILFY